MQGGVVIISIACAPFLLTGIGAYISADSLPCREQFTRDASFHDMCPLRPVASVSPKANAFTLALPDHNWLHIVKSIVGIVEEGHHSLKIDIAMPYSVLEMKHIFDGYGMR
ncbi:hypothetical protein BDV95DRAFT_590940 [Massariosphaeria phaeospora]|uniref:Uncharacterized protein n=1 Tax=Massariosphaeria phaeospora TaxID=100035 RepID=A0A7C8MCY6_9PLEO|nr:hypothetical protein BDV95DRAFT_590940 [Massariosphaeria phaeospora]